MAHSEDLGFTAQEKSGEITIFHNGRKATSLRGSKAAEFKDDLARLSFSERQQQMARLTGNYKRGNERAAREHPRNRR